MGNESKAQKEVEIKVETRMGWFEILMVSAGLGGGCLGCLVVLAALLSLLAMTLGLAVRAFFWVLS